MKYEACQAMQYSGAAGQLRWKCRRGSLELDCILSRFLKTQYHTLTDAQRLDFARLLDVSDPVLSAWLMGVERPSESGLAAIVDCLRRS